MRPLLAIARLTWKAAFRYRLFWVLALMLLGAVTLLPILVKDDGTVSGFVQILMTYTLSVTMVLLGFSTLWLSCGTLARDIEECQIQIVAVKPVSRWQIWMGKWVGIVSLNALLLVVAGTANFALLEYRSSRLPPQLQQVMREQILVSRAAFKPKAPDVEGEIRRRYELAAKGQTLGDRDREELMRRITDRVKAEVQVVAPRGRIGWDFDLGLDSRLRGDHPLFVRVKFYSASTNSAGLYQGVWYFTTPGSDTVTESPQMALAPESFQEFQISSRLMDDRGRLQVFFQSREDVSLLFPLGESIEILQQDGTFGLSFARGLGILLAWLALLSALGLATASITSFPVAAFTSMSILLVMLSSGTLAESVSNQTIIAGRPDEFTMLRPLLNAVFLPLFRAILGVVNLVNVASPVDLLSTGRSVTWALLFTAWFQVVGVAGGILAAVGITLLSRRELATAQGTS